MAVQTPHPYSAESMGLKPGDRVVYRGRDVYQSEGDGVPVRVLWAGVEGTVKSVHDGTPPQALETIDGAGGPFATVLFDNGLVHPVDEEFAWEPVERKFTVGTRIECNARQGQVVMLRPPRTWELGAATVDVPSLVVIEFEDGYRVAFEERNLGECRVIGVS